MPHGEDLEHENDAESLSNYECLQCGRIVQETTHPGACECGGEYHNRAKSLE